jgi:hypothetical protein
MKKLFLTLALALGGLAGLVPTAQAHPHFHGGFHYGCGYHYGCGWYDGCEYGYNCGQYGYWYWNNGCRFFRVVIVP